jgi:heat shock protein HslJ
MKALSVRTAALSLATLGLCAGPVFADALAGSEWRPVDLSGAAQRADTPVMIQFGGEGKVSGFGGCNRFSGAYRLSGERIVIGPLASTRMACVDEGAMQTEARFFRILQAAARFQRDRAKLSLKDEAGAIIARFAQNDWD